MKKTTDKQRDRLTPREFRAIVVGKGWSYNELAAFWGITRVWLSHIANDQNRALHYDDAVFGIPSKRFLDRAILKRQQAVSEYLNKAFGDHRKAPKVFRYSDYLEVGTIVTVSEDFGSMAESGMRGCVFNVRTTGRNDDFGIIFENGEFDWIIPEYIDKHLAQTGLVDEGMSGYEFTSIDRLKADYDSNRFNFYP